MSHAQSSRRQAARPRRIDAPYMVRTLQLLWISITWFFEGRYLALILFGITSYCAGVGSAYLPVQATIAKVPTSRV